MKSRLLKGALAAAVIPYMASSAYMWDTQRQHIFEPSALLQTDPARIGLRYEEAHIPVGQGGERGELFGWWLPAERRDAPVILYLHGNDKNIGHGHDLDSGARLHSMGYNVLMVDYRGYGRSSVGEPSEAKVYEDAEAAWRYLMESRASPPQRTFIYGHSLGGAIAIDLAVRHPEAAGLITESTFTTMTAMAKTRYGFLPVELLLNQYFDSLGKIARLKVPVLLIHGTWDAIIPPEMSRELFDHAPQPKQLKLIEGGEHTNSGGIGWVEYRDTVTAFVQKFAH